MNSFGARMMVFVTLLMGGSVFLETGCGGIDGTKGLSQTSDALEICDMDAIDDYYQIKEAVINGDQLVMIVQYACGCAEHDFRLCWDGSLMKSIPPQARLHLIHDGHGDTCEANCEHPLSFHLKPFEDLGNETIILLLDEHTLTYSFQDR